jgi:hypothetical protein
LILSPDGRGAGGIRAVPLDFPPRRSTKSESEAPIPISCKARNADKCRFAGRIGTLHDICALVFAR